MMDHTDTILQKPPLVTVDGVGGSIEHFGLVFEQTPAAVPILSRFLKTVHEDTGIGQVIELGARHGGLSVLLHLACAIYKAHFVTYDKFASIQYVDVFERLGIHCRIQDIFAPEGTREIQEIIARPGTTILLCDNGNKMGEFNHFSDYLKPGDYILAHDYAPNKTVLDARVVKGGWRWMEIQDSDIQEACARNELEPYEPEAFLEAAWVCKRKRI
jgi:hypothetical protein